MAASRQDSTPPPTHCHPLLKTIIKQQMCPWELLHVSIRVQEIISSNGIRCLETAPTGFHWRSRAAAFLWRPLPSDSCTNGLREAAVQQTNVSAAPHSQPALKPIYIVDSSRLSCMSHDLIPVSKQSRTYSDLKENILKKKMKGAIFFIGGNWQKYPLQPVL